MKSVDVGFGRHLSVVVQELVVLVAPDLVLALTGSPKPLRYLLSSYHVQGWSGFPYFSLLLSESCCEVIHITMDSST